MQKDPAYSVFIPSAIKILTCIVSKTWLDEKSKSLKISKYPVKAEIFQIFFKVHMTDTQNFNLTPSQRQTVYAQLTKIVLLECQLRNNCKILESFLQPYQQTRIPALRKLRLLTENSQGTEDPK